MILIAAVLLRVCEGVGGGGGMLHSAATPLEILVP